MGISKVILNGVTKVDLTQDTVASNNLLSGETATGADGEAVAGAITSKSSSDITVSGATVIVPAGYYSSLSSKAVAGGTAGTPAATKGTVSNRSVTVTPSVTNTTGYITGGTKTGTAVTVTAAELDSGTKTITENGTGIDVAGYAAVDVNVESVQTTEVPLTVTQNGTYTAPTGTAYTPVIVDVSGGGGATAEEKDVNFIDYDGTILYSYTPAEFAQLSALPANPSHAGLTAQGWNWSLADAKTYVSRHGKLLVGQMYITTSGATEIDISLTAPDLHPYLGIAPNGTVVIDWGDNSATDTVTGTSNTTLKFTGHEYAAAGDYTIKLTVSSGNFAFFTSSSAATYSGVLSNAGYSTRSSLYSNSIRSIRLGANVQLGSYAFNNCFSIKFITIPASVTSMATYTFYTCHALKTIIIPSSVTNVSNYSFSNCYNAEYIVIPNGVTNVGTGAFEKCYALESITIPDSVTNNTFSFVDCCSLKSVTLPTGLTGTASSLFNNCYSLESVDIPSDVTSIGASAFYNCYSLESVDIPSDVTSIGASAFYYCYALKFADIPSDVTSIGGSAFYNCRSLVSVNIPSGVTSIGSSTFASCYTLKSVVIPSGVTNIASQAFSGCYGLTEIHFLPTTPPTLANTNAFTNVPTTCVFYVPSGSLSAYQTATNWSTYASRMVEE